MNNANAFKVARFFYYAGCLTLCQLTIRPTLSLTLSDWLFFGALIAVVIELISFNRNIELRLPSLFTISCLLFVAGGVLSLLNENEKVTVLSVMVRFIYLTIVWFWLGIMVLRTTNHVKRATVFWLISVAVNGIAAALQMLDPSIIPGAAPVGKRMVGFTGHPNDLGAMSAVGWGAACALFNSVNLSRIMKFRYVLLIATLAGLILSGSTGSALAAITATVTWLLLARSKNNLVWLAIIMFSISIPFFTVQHLMGGQSIFHRLNKTVISSNGKPTTLGYRLKAYKAALIIIVQNPLIGVGSYPGGASTNADLELGDKNVDEKIRTQHSVHNAYLNAFYENGIFGFIGIIGLTLATYISARQLLAKTRGNSADQQLAIALSSAAVGFFVYAMSATVLYQRYGWISLALLFSLRAVMIRKAKFDY